MPALLLLCIFFSTSNLLGIWRRSAKTGLGFEKGGPRDQCQVLANGGPALIGLILGNHCLSDHFPTSLPLALFATGLAEANADTWATEIGSAIGGQPISILTGKKIIRGQSGGISPAGTAAAVFGATTIGICFALFNLGTINLAMAIVAGGFFGALADSYFGATVQAQFRNEEGNLVETPRADPRPTQGIAWFRNDAVNFSAGIVALLLMTAALWQK
jgi:uncharacterized protein (TIGR00297 family)